jgi:hypothetical protein
VLLEYQSISPIVSILFLKKNHFQVKKEMEVDMVLMRSSKNQMIKLQNQELKSQHLRKVDMVEFSATFLMALALTQTDSVQEILQSEEWTLEHQDQK